MSRILSELKNLQNQNGFNHKLKTYSYKQIQQKKLICEPSLKESLAAAAAETAPVVWPRTGVFRLSGPETETATPDPDSGGLLSELFPSSSPSVTEKKVKSVQGVRKIYSDLIII